MSVPTLLYLDSTGQTLHLAISQGNDLVAHQAIESTSHRYHSAILVPELRELLNQHKLTPEDLDGIVTNTGPGSFTGIRTGLATARTMGQWLNVVMLPLTQFDIWAMTAHQAGLPFPIACYEDGLRGRTYHAVMGWEENQPVMQVSPTLITPEHPDTDALPVVTSLMADGLIPYWKESFGENIPLSLSTLNPDMPVVVHQALQTLGEPIDSKHPWAKPWQDVLPLYVQRPNITLSKTQPQSSVVTS